MIATDGGYHGKTMGALSATGNKEIPRAIFEPLLPDVCHVPFNDLDSA